MTSGQVQTGLCAARVLSSQTMTHDEGMCEAGQDQSIREAPDVQGIDRRYR